MKQVGTNYYVHHTAVRELRPDLRAAVTTVRRMAPYAKGWDVVRVAADAREVMLGRTTDWTRNAHPELLESVVFRKRGSRWREHRRATYNDPPVYHRKETMLPSDHPKHALYARLTEAEDAAGLLGRSDIGRRSSWARALAAAGYAVKGHKLVRASRTERLAAPGYASWKWTQQDWRVVVPGKRKPDVSWDDKCGGKSNRTPSGKVRLCLPLPVIRQLRRTAEGKRILYEQAMKKQRAEPGTRVAWHPRIRELHSRLEAEGEEDDPAMRTERLPTTHRTREPVVPSLSTAQWTALESFAQHGGHGYGEGAYLSRTTAQSLDRAGLVELGHRRTGRRSLPWGQATLFGVRALAAKRSAERGTTYEDEALALLRFRSPDDLARYEAQLAEAERGGHRADALERLPTPDT